MWLGKQSLGVTRTPTQFPHLSWQPGFNSSLWKTVKMEGNGAKQVSLHFEFSRPGEHSTRVSASSMAVPRHLERLESNFSEKRSQHGLLISVHLETQLKPRVWRPCLSYVCIVDLENKPSRIERTEAERAATTFYRVKEDRCTVTD